MFIPVPAPAGVAFEAGSYVQHVKTGKRYKVLDDYRRHCANDARVSCMAVDAVNLHGMRTIEARFLRAIASPLAT